MVLWRKKMVQDLWRLLDVEYNDPYMNLAVEEIIARKVGEGTVPSTTRFWRNPNTVVIGYSQCAALEVNFEACREYRTKIVRRFTGGGAVYHDHGNLNYSICLRRDNRLVQRDFLETFKFLSLGVINGLKTLGVGVEFEPINNLCIKGKKISGAAGSIKWGTIFHHGSILVNSDLEKLSRVLSFPTDRLKDKHARATRKAVTTLSAELARDVSIAEVKEALKRGFKKTFAIELVNGELTGEEQELARKLFKEKYTTDEWNFRRQLTFKKFSDSTSIH